MSKSTIIKLEYSGGTCYRIRSTPAPDKKIDQNQVYTQRGKAQKSKKNLINPGALGFGASSRRNLRKCTDIFYWARVEAGGTGSTWRTGWLKASLHTFTIPDGTFVDSKKGFDRLLKKLIQWLIYTYGVRDYLWKYEIQTLTRTQGHWHMIVDRFIPKDEIKAQWIKYLREAGYLDQWDAKHDNDPTFAHDVRGIKSDSMLRRYLEKYFLKQGQNPAEWTGRAWGCSLWIKQAPAPVVPFTRKFQETMETCYTAGSIDVKEIRISEGGDISTWAPGKCPEDGDSWLCTVFRTKPGMVQLMLDPWQRSWFDKYISAFRAGNAEAAQRVKAQVLGTIPPESKIHSGIDFPDPKYSSNLIMLWANAKQSSLPQMAAATADYVERLGKAG